MDEQTRSNVKTLIAMARALRTSMDESLRAEAPDDVWKHSSFSAFARKYNQLATSIAKLIRVNAPIDVIDEATLPGLGDSHAMVQKLYFESIRANLSMLIAYVEEQIGVTRDEAENLKNFIAAKLRPAIFNPPQSEKEVQNALEQILIGRGDVRGVDYDRETGRTKVSVKESIRDFIFPRLSLALEVKLAKEKAKLGAIVDELNADIVSYSTTYSQLACVVYDMGCIQNEAQFKSGLEKAGHVSVIVVKH